MVRIALLSLIVLTVAQVHSASAAKDYLLEPNGFLVEMVAGVKPGKALDVGMGDGRNAIFLARKGWDVTGFDSWEPEVKKARENAAKAGVSIKTLLQRDKEFDWGTERWDLIVLSYVNFRPFVDRIMQSLKPGGLVMVEFFHLDTKRMRPVTDDMVFDSNELLRIFSQLRILRYEDVTGKQDWGISEGSSNRLVRLWAQKQGNAPPKGCTLQDKPYPTGSEACWSQFTHRCDESGWVFTGKECH